MSDSAIPAASRTGELPLSYSELMMAQRALRDPSLRAHNSFLANLLIGPLDRVALAASLDALARRQEILRTGFVMHAGHLIRAIGEPGPTLDIVDLQSLDAPARDAEAQRLSLAAIQREFDLTRPMMRATLFVLAPTRHVLVLTLHHAIADAWSLGIVARELARLYGQQAHGDAADLPPLRIQYADYAAWKHAQLTGERLETLTTRWTQRLQDLPAPLALPPAPEATTISTEGASTTFALAAPLVEAIRQVSRRHRVTPFTTLLAAFTSILSRMTDQTDLIVVVPVSDRTGRDLQDLVGLFIDMVLVRVDCAANPTFAEFLARVQQAAAVLYATEALPLPLLSRCLGAQADRLRGLGQVVFNVVNWRDPRLDLPGLTAAEWPIDFHEPVRGALTLNMRAFVDDPLRMDGILKYPAARFPADWIARVIAQIRSTLAQAVADPTRRLDEYSFDASLQNRSA
jgi:hypothetical protein